MSQSIFNVYDSLEFQRWYLEKLKKELALEGYNPLKKAVYLKLSRVYTNALAHSLNLSYKR